ncbi:MAG: hypothetical protein U5R48_18475 [Gammaproteobacteria bacterium]|nr:hypothetical protein [Gammaproteobacteria bacterium]
MKPGRSRTTAPRPASVANRRIGAIIGCANDIEGLQPLAARMTLAMQIEFDHQQCRPSSASTTIGSPRSPKFLDENPDRHCDHGRPRGQRQPRQARRRSPVSAPQSVADYLVDELRHRAPRA